MTIEAVTIEAVTIEAVTIEAVTIEAVTIEAVTIEAVTIEAMTIEDLFDNFDLFDDWEEKYRYIIDLGKKLPAMPDADKTDANKVRGCMSQVWLTSRPSEKTPGAISFSADSDAFIVKGLIAILMVMFDEKTPEEIAAIDAIRILSEIGLDTHLSPNRRNGLVAMVDKIKHRDSMPH